ncbi:serine/threonine protein kinase [Streptomyces sp. SLBN-118]|uniref:protein kinase n=1 Tax=Streptomyces sp. SLBN-118 TaxID=2768454 RepID=UPI0011504DA4|nr:protein kinase [Streptomyces sp. SLBN-118]TQK52417.1 serine/threonine protein kinase [Streptomyces sp. SLBN-118]
MDDYAGRVLADRYRLPLPPSDAYELVETRAFDTYSGQEVLVRQVPLPEVVDAEVVETDGIGGSVPSRTQGRTTRRPTDPAVRRAIEAAQAAAQIPDHPRLDQVFDVFAEGGSLWIVSERVAARPLAALLAEHPLSPYRAAEVASDVLTALRVLHAHGWTHRNITSRTVLVCDDGRVVLTGLASGAAEEALCGYAPVPGPPDDELAGIPGPPEAAEQGEAAPLEAGTYADPDDEDPEDEDTDADGDDGPYGASPGARVALPRPGSGVPDARAARAGAIAAYRAGARAAARADENEREGDRPVQAGFDPDWWARRPGEPGPPLDIDVDDIDDDIDDEEEDGGWSGPGRVRLAGRWHDASFPAQDGPRPLPAGGSPGAGRPAARGHNDPYGARPALPGPRPGSLPAPSRPGGSAQDALRADAQRADAQRRPVVAEVRAPTGHWDEIVAGGTIPAYRGPATPLAAERARQARIAVVGAVTERWAPEQAGPVHENWQLAAPVGPATDLWALGALLYRAVQGHAPYPEESAVELVQLVCSEPPAFAEECGPLRPVVESLLRQDPTERPDFEELRGWLRSLVRSAPEPEAGMDVVPVPSAPADGSRLPVVRRRGELVRKRRGSAEVVHGRHRHKKSRRERRGPRSLGRTLLLLVLLLLVAAVAYAVVFMPKADSQQRDGSHGKNGGRPTATGPGPDASAPDNRPSTPATSPGAQQPQTSAPAGNIPYGYALRKDPEGFQIAVQKSWQRHPINDVGQVRYTDGDFILIVVPGRDTVKANGDDPLTYQRDKERELQPWRDSSWAGASGLRRIEVGQQAMAEGQFTWQDSNGREVYVRNLALVIGGAYHVVQVIGPEDQRDKVAEVHQEATKAYRTTR